MKIKILVALVALSWAPALAGGRHPEHSERTIRETLALGPDRILVVDNLNGSIRIAGTRGADVELVAVERIYASSDRRAEQARREVSLEIEERDGALVICADGPFRSGLDCTAWRDGDRWDPDYEVWFEIELRVPRHADIDVRTVQGDIEIRDVRGNFDVRGVNGELRLSGMAGSGRAHTVNGPVTVAFVENPAEDSSFKTINGEIDVSFSAGLAADMTFETLNGEIFSDFDYEMLSPQTVRQESRHRTKFRLESNPRVRVGAGGPRFHFENINGDIFLRRG